jgi:hypothetical protein
MLFIKTIKIQFGKDKPWQFYKSLRESLITLAGQFARSLLSFAFGFGCVFWVLRFLLDCLALFFRRTEVDK